MSAGLDLVTGRRLAGERDRFFFGGMALAIALTIFAGFARTYYLKDVFGSPALSPLVHLHGLLFTCWILLFAVQTTLISVGRPDIHRRTGIAGALLAAAMVVAGLLVAIGLARRGVDPSGRGEPLQFMAIPLFDLLLFAALVSLGVYWRSKSRIHKRLMLLATIALIPPALFRIPPVGAAGLPVVFGVADLFIVVCLVYDKMAHGRVHPAFLWGGLALALSLPVRLAVSGTAAWVSFARWLTG
jgi:hypothetical membrane protein